MRALFLSLALASTGCATAGTGAAADAGTDASDAETFEAGSTCPSALSCNILADCVGPGTTAACWQCLAGCCVPITPGNDPKKACDAGSACMVSSCDGAGSCSLPVPARTGTPCGATCGGIFVFASSSCRNGICVGEAATQSACPDRCFGDYTDCPICDPTGCVASCDPLNKHPDRCFP
jgi:hypothetical protein